MKTFFCKIVGQPSEKCVSMPARSSMDILQFCFVITTLNLDAVIKEKRFRVYNSA